MHREKTSDESISTPGSHHVPVGERTESSIKHGTKLQSLDPEVEGENEEENGDGFIVITTSDRS